MGYARAGGRVRRVKGVGCVGIAKGSVRIRGSRLGMRITHEEGMATSARQERREGKQQRRRCAGSLDHQLENVNIAASRPGKLVNYILMRIKPLRRWKNRSSPESSTKGHRPFGVSAEAVA